jgi:hypothetical protein
VLVPLLAALALWAGCIVLDSAPAGSGCDGCVEEAAAIVQSFARQDDALQAQQRQVRGEEAARIAPERRTLRERMEDEVARVYQRYGRQWRQRRE